MTKGSIFKKRADSKELALFFILRMNKCCGIVREEFGCVVFSSFIAVNQ